MFGTMQNKVLNIFIKFSLGGLNGYILLFLNHLHVEQAVKIISSETPLSLLLGYFAHEPVFLPDLILTANSKFLR
jgi:hypothetical protein